MTPNPRSARNNNGREACPSTCVMKGCGFQGGRAKSPPPRGLRATTYLMASARATPRWTHVWITTAWGATPCTWCHQEDVTGSLGEVIKLNSIVKAWMIIRLNIFPEIKSWEVFVDWRECFVIPFLNIRLPLHMNCKHTSSRSRARHQLDLELNFIHTILNVNTEWMDFFRSYNCVRPSHIWNISTNPLTLYPMEKWEGSWNSKTVPKYWRECFSIYIIDCVFLSSYVCLSINIYLCLSVCLICCQESAWLIRLRNKQENQVFLPLTQQ